MLRLRRGSSVERRGLLGCWAEGDRSLSLKFKFKVKGVEGLKDGRRKVKTTESRVEGRGLLG
ncbi:MAG: hypothetical protein RLZZ184_2940 [Cyanobacteriota bacterium]|jgi:hypothetical protein